MSNLKQIVMYIVAKTIMDIQSIIHDQDIYFHEGNLGSCIILFTSTSASIGDHEHHRDHHWSIVQTSIIHQEDNSH